jgi:hypothetical protein
LSPGEGWILLQDRPLQPPKLLSGLEPKLFVEQAPPQGMLSDEPFELRDDPRVPSQLQVGLDPLLERSQPLLLEPRPLVAGDRFELSERRPPPQRERGAQPLGGNGCVNAAHLFDQALETAEIELKRSRGTTSFACSSRIASTARCLAPPSFSSRPSSSTSSGPRMRNSMPSLVL